MEERSVAQGLGPDLYSPKRDSMLTHAFTCANVFIDLLYLSVPAVTAFWCFPFIATFSGKWNGYICKEPWSGWRYSGNLHGIVTPFLESMRPLGKPRKTLCVLCSVPWALKVHPRDPADYLLAKMCLNWWAPIMKGAAPLALFTKSMISHAIPVAGSLPIAPRAALWTCWGCGWASWVTFVRALSDGELLQLFVNCCKDQLPLLKG